MQFVLILISIFFSIFSTTVMAYISMATPIGPWIAPTLILIGSLIFRLFKKNVSSNLVYSVSAGSIGGILATALGFSFPTIFFLDPVFFNNLIGSPTKFVLIVSGLSLVAGFLAYVFCEKFDQGFLQNKNLHFPISSLIYEAIHAQSSFKQSIQMLYGVISTAIFCFLQDGIYNFRPIIPMSINILNSFKVYIFDIPAVKFDLFPLYWAIGYVGGSVIALPLLAGTISKIFFADPINKYFFNIISHMDFMLAFASGLVLYTAVSGFFSTLFSLKKGVSVRRKFMDLYNLPKLESKFIVMLALCLTSCFLYFNAIGLGIFVQVYLVIFTLICTYQVVSIAGKIGLAQLGRFATFVMIPAVLFFNVTHLQITVIATFVELCAGISTDLIFSRKVGQLSNLPLKNIKMFQVLGIIVSATISGIIFYLIIKNLGLGSDLLFAQRAQTRALLVNFEVLNFNVLLIGFIFGFILKYIKLNPMFVLGGLLMPLNITISLLTGALLEKVLSKKYNLQPFWSGIFATQSIWIFLRAII